MRIRIYQIDSNKDEHNIKFHGLNSNFRKKLVGAGVDAAIYDCVYEKEMPEMGLEELYVMFNIEHPDDFRGHSMSVSDVVGVWDSSSGAVEDGFYFCDNAGFHKIDFESQFCKKKITERKPLLHVFWGECETAQIYARELLEENGDIPYFRKSEDMLNDCIIRETCLCKKDTRSVATDDPRLILYLLDSDVHFEVILVRMDAEHCTFLAEHFSREELICLCRQKGVGGIR